ncbi:MAG: hypothetical protein IJ808_03065 [Muribaculaceae bacterium]|nr:hypothetical protein [Muribaculaceae bacterium]
MMHKTLITLATVVATILGAAAQDQWSIGLQAGLAGTTPTSTTKHNLKDNFDGCVAFTGGVTAQYGRVRFKVDATYGQPSFNRYNIFGVMDGQGHDAQINATANASLTLVGVQPGFTVLRTGRLSITPAAGIMWSHYSWTVNDIEWSKNDAGEDQFQVKDKHNATLSHVGWMASVDFDIRLRDSYTDVLGPQQRLRQSLRITPWIGQASYDKCYPHAKGYHLGLSVAYSGMLSWLQ